MYSRKRQTLSYHIENVFYHKTFTYLLGLMKTKITNYLYATVALRYRTKFCKIKLKMHTDSDGPYREDLDVGFLGIHLQHFVNGLAVLFSQIPWSCCS